MTTSAEYLDRGRLAQLAGRETTLFAERHPGSRAAQDAAGSLLGGVPMPWMARWPTPYPIRVERAEGATVVDVDGNRYVDFCLGDSAAMAGHAPAAVAAAVAEQVTRGITCLLPGAADAEVAAELARRFGLPQWQFALSATDANRFVLRLAREITGRCKVLVFAHCYHGTVDETIVLPEDGRAVPRPDSVGPGADPDRTTKVVDFNDVDALAAALADRDVACVLTEPALTNIGIVEPESGFHDALRRLTRETGTLLVIDETHTWSAGAGGYTAAHGLDPDILTIGKAIGGGVPAAAYALSEAVAQRVRALTAPGVAPKTKGVGGTLAGNALSVAAVRATLAEVLTEDAFAAMTALADRFAAGVQATIERHRLPWHVSTLGARAEYQFTPRAPRGGIEAAGAGDRDLDRYLRLYLINRGVLMTPFHCMALMSPATTTADVDRHTELFAAVVAELVA